MHVNQQYVPLCFVVSDPCVSKLLFPFPHPSTTAATILGAISIDVILQQAGMKGNRRNTENNSLCPNSI